MVDENKLHQFLPRHAAAIIEGRLDFFLMPSQATIPSNAPSMLTGLSSTANTIACSSGSANFCVAVS